MKILVSALEYSANIHLKSLLRYLPNDTELMGVFDKELGNPIVDLQSTAVMGYVDAIKKLRFYFKLADQMATLAQDTDIVLLIDASGFNLPLAKRIKKRYPNKKIIYYILPEAWAWKKGRIKHLEERISKLCSIIPFEAKHYSKNASIEYVGHPLLDQIKEFKTSINNDIKTIAFMPGSRKSAISKLMPLYREINSRLDIQAIIVIPRSFSTDEIKEFYGNLAGFTISHDSHRALRDSDFAFICKGTATLEASLIGTPLILTYEFSSLDYIIYKKLVQIPYLSLGNIFMQEIKGRKLHPEFIQKLDTNELITSMQNMDRERFFGESQELRGYLKCGSAEHMAKIIMKS